MARPIVKKLTKGILVMGGGFAFLLCIGIFWLSDKYVVPILMYHHINDPSQGSTLENVSPENFFKQMEFLKKHNFNVIGLDELTQGIKSGHSFRHKTVVITLDDGYADNYYHALPILKEFQFPVTLFISPGFLETKGFLTWAQLKEMVLQGITIGSHTISHTYLPHLKPNEVTYEVFASKKILEEQLGRSVDYFAYPLGGFNELTKYLVRKNGYHGAVTTNRGRERFNRDIYELNRIRFSNRDRGDLILWAKLSGYYNLFREPRGSH